MGTVAHSSIEAGSRGGARTLASWIGLGAVFLATLLVLAMGLAGPAWALDPTHWTGEGATALWSNSDNWSNGVPVDGQEIIMDGELQQNASLYDLTLTAPGSITFSGGDPFWNVGTNASATVTLPSFTLADSGTTVYWQVPSPAMAQDSAISVAAGCELNLTETINNGGRTPVFSGAGTVNITGAISGSGGITTSVGLLTLSESNTYSGKTAVTGGTLKITNGSCLGTVPASLVSDQLALNGGTLQASPGGIGFSLSATRGITLGASGGTVSVDTGVTLTTACPFTGSGRLAKSGDGILRLQSTSSGNTGGMTISGGEVELPAQACLGPVPSTTTADSIILDGGRLTFTNTSAYFMDAKRGITVGSGGGTLNSSVSITLNQVIAGSGNLTVNSSGYDGTLRLAATCTYSGTTTLWRGMLYITGSNVSSATTVNPQGAVVGTGTAGATAIYGTIAPGTTTLGSTRTITTGAQTWYSDGTYIVDMNSAIGEAGASVGWDLIDAPSLDLRAGTDARFIVKFEAGELEDFDMSQPYWWKIVDTTTLTTLGETGFDPTRARLNATTFLTNNMIAEDGQLYLVGKSDGLYIYYSPQPTSVMIRSFKARVSAKGKVSLVWRTAQQGKTVGFVLQRFNKATGKWQRVNRKMMPVRWGSTAGATYKLYDAKARAGKLAKYRLRLVNADGHFRTYGPYKVRPTRL